VILSLVTLVLVTLGSGASQDYTLVLLSTIVIVCCEHTIIVSEGSTSVLPCGETGSIVKLSLFDPRSGSPSS
jgi:hypothetical protein